MADNKKNISDAIESLNNMKNVMPSKGSSYADMGKGLEENAMSNEDNDDSPNADGVYDSIEETKDNLRKVKDAFDDAKDLKAKLDKYKESKNNKPEDAKPSKNQQIQNQAMNNGNIGAEKGAETGGKAAEKGAEAGAKAAEKGAEAGAEAGAKAAETAAGAAAGAATAGVGTVVMAAKDAIKAAVESASDDADAGKSEKGLKAVLIAPFGLLFFGVMGALMPMAIILILLTNLANLPRMLQKVTEDQAQYLESVSDNGEGIWGKGLDYIQKFGAEALYGLSWAEGKLADGTDAVKKWYEETTREQKNLNMTDAEFLQERQRYDNAHDYKSAMEDLYGTFDKYCEKTLAWRRTQLSDRIISGDLSAVSDENGKLYYKDMYGNPHAYKIDAQLTLENFDKQGNPFAAKNNTVLAAGYATYDNDYMNSNISNLEQILDKNADKLLKYDTQKIDPATKGLNNVIDWKPVTVKDYDQKDVTLKRLDFINYLAYLSAHSPNAKLIQSAVKYTNEKAKEDNKFFTGIGFNYMPTKEELQDVYSDNLSTIQGFDSKDLNYLKDRQIKTAYDEAMKGMGDSTTAKPGKYFQEWGRFGNSGTDGTHGQVPYDAKHFYLPALEAYNVNLYTFLVDDQYKFARQVLLGKHPADGNPHGGRATGKDVYNLGDYSVTLQCGGQNIVFTNRDVSILKEVVKTSGKATYYSADKNGNFSKDTETALLQKHMAVKDKYIVKKNYSLSKIKQAAVDRACLKAQKQLYEDNDKIQNLIALYDATGFKGGFEFTLNFSVTSIKHAEEGSATYSEVIPVYLPDEWKNVKVLVPNGKTHEVGVQYAPYTDSELYTETDGNGNTKVSSFQGKRNKIDALAKAEADKVIKQSQKYDNIYPATMKNYFPDIKGSIEWNGFDLPAATQGGWGEGAQGIDINNTCKVVYPDEWDRFFLTVTLQPFQSTDVFDIFDLDKDTTYEHSQTSRVYDGYDEKTQKATSDGTTKELANNTWTDTSGVQHTTHITNEQMYNNYYKTISSQMDGANTLSGDGSVSSVARTLTDDEINAYVQRAANQGASKNRQQVIKTALSISGMVPYYYGGKPSGPGWNEDWGSQTVPDHRGRTRKGLDCSGFVYWTNWTAFNDNSYAGSLNSTSTIMGLQHISASELKPGDIGVTRNAAEQHTGIYLGKDDNGNLMWVHTGGNPEMGPVIVTNSNMFEVFCRNPYPTIEGSEIWQDGIVNYGPNIDFFYILYNTAHHEDGAAWTSIVEAICNHEGGGNGVAVEQSTLTNLLANPNSHYLWDGALTEYERICGRVLSEESASKTGKNVGDELPDKSHAIQVPYKNIIVKAFKWDSSTLVTPSETDVAEMKAIMGGKRTTITDNSVAYWRGHKTSLSGYTYYGYFGNTGFFKP